MKSPYMKFAGASLVTFLLVLVAWVQQGTLDGPAFELGFMGLAASSLTFWITNASRGVAKYAKAVYPAALAAFAIGVHYVVSGGEFSEVDLRAAIAAGLTALIVAGLGNAPEKPTPMTGRMA